MRILFDNCTSRKLRQHLKLHEVRLAKEEGWADLANGKLLSVAQDSFDAVVTNDKSIRYQQRLSDYTIALIVKCFSKTGFLSFSDHFKEF